MARLGIETEIVDEKVFASALAWFRKAKIALPTFAQLADPSTVDAAITAGVDKNAPDPANLWRVHWYNDLAGNRVSVPDHVVLPKALTGVDAPIIVAFGDRFPMITAHKVLAAYACLAPRVVTGQFDPTRHRAIWPSTGNYARGGIAISRIMASRGVAILPAGMSQERFDWLDRWCANPAEDVIKTVGTESNVKEIYDECARLDREPRHQSGSASKVGTEKVSSWTMLASNSSRCESSTMPIMPCSPSFRMCPALWRISFFSIFCQLRSCRTRILSGVTVIRVPESSTSAKEPSSS